GEPSCLLQGRFVLGVRRASSAAQHFDGHGPVELDIVAEVYGTEAARPQGAPHLIAAEGRGRGRDGPRRRGHDRRSGRRVRRKVRGLLGHRRGVVRTARPVLRSCLSLLGGHLSSSTSEQTSASGGLGTEFLALCTGGADIL